MEVNNNHEQSQPQVMANTVFPTPNSSSSLHEDQTQANDSDHEAFSEYPYNISFSNSPAKINNNNNNNNNVVSETIINNLSHCTVCKCHCNDDENYLGSFPPGYRFVPFDDELIVHYLRRKVLDQPLPQNKIREVDLYRHSPEILTERYQGLGEKEWYFFTPRNRKYRNGTRPNRAAGSGYWKATGADKPITHKGIKVGSRKALVFYEGKAPEGKKTSWIMHEYRVEDPPKSRRGANDMRLDDWVLCRVYKKCDKFVKVHQREEEREAVVSSKTYSDEASFLPTSGNGPEPYFLSETDELVDKYPKYVQPLLQNGVLYEIPQFTDDSLMKLAKFNNNNLMSSHNYGGGGGGGRPVVPFTTPPVYSDHLRTLYPKDDNTWGTSVSRGGYQVGDICSGISNSDNCEIWSQYFSNTSNLDSLRSLETVMQNNPTNSPQMSPQN